MNQNQIAVSVLTGYLGSGKTTLLNRILSEPHGKKYAVIVNEFGEIGIDGDLIVRADEEIFEMNNGCICCTVRGDLIRVISGLLKRAKSFDGILIETTGLADPAPVAQTFFADAEVAAKAKLDSIITVVDAKHLPQRLLDCKEAAEQIAFADVILLNKTDLVSADELRQVEKSIRAINNFATLIPCSRGQVPLNKILGLGSFDLTHVLEHDPDFIKDARRAEAHSHEENHVAAAGITSLSFKTDRALDIVKFENWMGDLRTNKGNDLLRYKGILNIAGSDKRLAIQGVHMMMDANDLQAWESGAARISKMVFIGRNLDGDELRQGFMGCVS